MLASVPLNINIIGAGLSGLAAAVSCALGGHKVLVLESAHELAEIGAGVQITPNGTKVLQQLGVYDKLVSEAAEPTLLQYRRYYDGRPLARIKNFDKEMRRLYGSPFWDIHRVDLQRALVERAETLGVVVRLNARVVNIDFNTPSLTLESGEKLEADLVVAADGLWSNSRVLLLATQSKSDVPLPTGDLAFRIILHAKDIDDPELKHWIEHPSCQFWLGPGAHVVAYSVRGGRTLNIVLLVPDNLPPDVARQPGSLDEMRQLFKDWDPVLNRFLSYVKSVDKWKLMHRKELESSVNEKSNCVFIGDSAHSMLPYLAQGANISLEDGAVLGFLLAALKSKAQLPHLLDLYEQSRKQRGDAVARESFAQRDVLHMYDGAEQRERDELMFSKLDGVIDCKFPIRWQCPEAQPWLFGYDAQGDALAALRSTVDTAIS